MLYCFGHVKIAEEKWMRIIFALLEKHPQLCPWRGHSRCEACGYDQQHPGVKHQKCEGSAEVGLNK